jgi:hypothetical protein
LDFEDDEGDTVNRVIRALIVAGSAMFLASSAPAEERDVRQSLLDMFRAQVNDLSDFDEDICGTSGDYYLLSSDGTWSCEAPGASFDHSNYLTHTGSANDMSAAICGHNTTTDDCATFNWQITTLGIATFGRVDADQYNLPSGGTAYMNFGANGAVPTYYQFNADGGYAVIDGSFIAAESATVPFDVGAGWGHYWVKNTVPATPMFTDDASVDWTLAQINSSDQLLLADGLVTAPALTFTSDPDTGIYHHASTDGHWYFATNGTALFEIKAGAVRSIATFRVHSGVLSAPSLAFYHDTNTGIMQDGSIAFVANGVTAGYFDDNDDFYVTGNIIPTGELSIDHIGDPTGDIAWIFQSGETFSITASSSVSDNIFLQRVNATGTSPTVDAFIYQLDNETSSGTLDGFLVQVLNSSTNQGINIAFEIAHGEDVGAMQTGLYIRGTSTGAINTAINVADAEIVDAINIGSNVFVTTGGDIASADFDTLFDNDGTVDLGDTMHRHEIVLQRFAGTVNLDDECLFPGGFNNINVVTAGCTNIAYDWYAPKDFTVTEIVSGIVIAGDAGYGCIVQPLVDDVTAGTAQTIATSAAAGTVTRTTQSFSVAEGEVLAIQVLDGVDALLCDIGTDPRLYVEVFGYYTE